MGYLFWLERLVGRREEALKKLRNAEVGFEEMEIKHRLDETIVVIKKIDE